VQVLSLLARWCAVLAGALMTIITLLTCGNLILRNTTGDAMVGAFEITAFSTGAAIALFMPLCQLRRGHIIVDFFTSRLRDSVNDWFDRVGALALGLAFVILTWRTAVGGWSAYEAGSQSMLMGISEWLVYAAMLGPFALTALIGLSQAALGFDRVKESA
jgi:TRAP-type C4-dicarboxylate transport system permease small subunit